MRTQTKRKTQETRGNKSLTCLTNWQTEDPRKGAATHKHHDGTKKDDFRRKKEVKQLTRASTTRTYSSSSASREIQNRRPSEAKPNTRTCRISGRSTNKAMARVA